MIWKNCISYHIPLIYASSAATYGLGEFGFDNEANLCDKLVPLNPYGDSKNEFDILKAIDAKELFITSNVTLNISKAKDLIINVKKAKGTKCSRCWKIVEKVKNDKCSRCSEIK